MQIVVLGMHRSGTSLVSCLLNLMGAYIGDSEELLPPNSSNLKGFGERYDVMGVNDRLLGSVGADWCKVSSFQIEEISGGERQRFEEEAGKVLAKLEAHRPWVLKDPRLCLLFPLWRPLLNDPFCILVYRRPAEVALSLRARDGFPIAFGLALWELHTRSSLNVSEGLSRILVSYNELMADPAPFTRRLHETMVAAGGVSLVCPGEDRIGRLVDPSLLNQQIDEEALDGFLNTSQRRLYHALKDGSDLDAVRREGISSGARAAMEDQERNWGRWLAAEQRLSEAVGQIRSSRQNLRRTRLVADSMAVEARKKASVLMVKVSEAEKKAAASERKAAEAERQTAEAEQRTAEVKRRADSELGKARETLLEVREDLARSRESALQAGRSAAAAEKAGAEVALLLESARETVGFQNEKLSLLRECLSHIEGAFSELIVSKRWKAGNAAGEVARRILLRQRRPGAVEAIAENLRVFRETLDKKPVQKP